MKAYGQSYGYDPARWSFLTGPADKIGELARLSDVTFQREGGFFNHDLRTLIIDPAGRLQMTFPVGGNLADAIVDEMLKALAATDQASRLMRAGSRSFHALAHVDQHPVNRVNPDQAQPGIFEVEDHIGAHGHDGRETEDVNSAAFLPSGHAKARKECSGQRQHREHGEDDRRRMRFGGDRPRSDYIEHLVERREQQQHRTLAVWCLGEQQTESLRYAEGSVC